MKRLILMGGRPWLAKDGGKRFVDTLLRYYPKKAKVAFCIFAQSEADWPETQSVNKKMFEAFKEGRSFRFQVMSAENFAEVSAWADIIYLPGGSTARLLAALEMFDLYELWDGKLIAGASAGTNLFCAGFVSLQDKTFGHGLGWVQATCIPHWRAASFEGFTEEDWDWAEAESLRQMPNVPLLCLPESDFVEITVAR